MLFKKILLTVLFALGLSAGAFAADLVALTFNFDADGEITPVGELPEGIEMHEKVRFSNKSLPGHAFSFDIDLDQVRTFKQTFKVQGEGRLVLSVNPRTEVDGKRQKTVPRVKCAKMIVKGASEFKGKPYKTPFVFDKWRYACPEMSVKDGDTITVEATFVKIGGASAPAPAQPAASAATDFVGLTFNFYAEGDITPVEDLPEGVKMHKKVRFSNKSLPGHAYGMDIDLGKVRSFKHVFKIEGDGKLVVSVNPRTEVGGKRQKTAPRVKCTRMVVNGKPAKTPFVFNRWRYAADPVMVKNGDTVAIEAAFTVIR